MIPTRAHFLAVVATVAVGMTGSAALSQVGSIDLPRGTEIPNGNWEVFKVVQCGLDHAFLGYKECSVELYREGQLVGGGPRRYPADQLLKDLNSAREAKGLTPLTRDQASGRAPYPEAVTTGPAAPALAPRALPAPRAAPAAAAAAPAPGGQCPRTPYAVVPGSRPASVALLKQVMESGHTFQRSAYLWTGVTFESFSVGATVRNKITMRPGVGPERVTDAAPVDAALYPIRATYVLCHQYSSGPDQTRIKTGNYCFVSRTGNWACGTDSNVAKYIAEPVA